MDKAVLLFLETTAGITSKYDGITYLVLGIPIYHFGIPYPEIKSVPIIYGIALIIIIKGSNPILL